MNTKTSNSKNTILNLTVAAEAAFLLWFILSAGEKLNTTVPQLQSSSSSESFIEGLFAGLHFQHSLSVLILQILVIIVVSRLLGWLMSLINQPTVIGEILAGIALGPSLLGMFFPEFTQFLFSVESLGNLEFLSQIGMILFMFIIGMKLDMGVIRQTAGCAGQRKIN